MSGNNGHLGQKGRNNKDSYRDGCVLGMVREADNLVKISCPKRGTRQERITKNECGKWY